MFKKIMQIKQIIPQPKALRGMLLLIVLISQTFLLTEETSLAAQPPPAAASILTTVDSGTYSSLTFNSSGFPVISYKDFNNHLKVAVCNDAACTNPTRNTVDTVSDGGWVSSLVLNDSGNPVISYQGTDGADVATRTLKVAVCNDTACSTTPTINTVDNGGGQTSLALNGSGFPVISYQGTDGADVSNLKVAVCNDATCSMTPTINTVDSDAGRQTSLALNSSGFPIISYQGTDGSDDVRIINLKVAVCNDAACSTTPTINTVDSAGNVGEATSLALNGSGFPVISYQGTDGADVSNLKVAVCNDATCSTTPTINTVDSAGSVGEATSLVLNGSGFPVISYQGTDGADVSNLKVVVCNDATCSTTPTISTVDSAGSVGEATSLALNSSGFPVISYYDETNLDLKMAICNICLAPTRTTVDSPGAVGLYTSLALNSSGNPVISYYDNTNVANGDLKVAFCDDAACSNPSPITVDTAINVGYTSLALNSNGLPVIGYYDDNDDDLELAICNDADCSNPTRKTIDSAENVGKYPSLVLNGSGFPVISYFDESNLDLKVAVCNDAACSNPTLNTVDDASKLVGAYTSLALNSSGFPVISYYSYTNSSLELAVCNDAVCSSAADIRTLDSGGDVGWFTSLALNSNGFPVISYYDSSEDDLKVAVCNNAACTQPTITIVDSTGDVGRYTSLALTNSDYPIISYYDLDNGDLKVAICNDITCTNPTVNTVDSPGTVGEYSSLALNSSGYPVISYYDGSPNANLKVAVFEPPAAPPANDPTPTPTSVPTETPSAPPTQTTLDQSVYLPILSNGD